MKTSLKQWNGFRMLRKSSGSSRRVNKWQFGVDRTRTISENLRWHKWTIVETCFFNYSLCLESNFLDCESLQWLQIIFSIDKAQENVLAIGWFGHLEWNTWFWIITSGSKQFWSHPRVCDECCLTCYLSGMKRNIKELWIISETNH